jgi:hypothetical protein
LDDGEEQEEQHWREQHELGRRLAAVTGSEPTILPSSRLD